MLERTLETLEEELLLQLEEMETLSFETMTYKGVPAWEHVYTHVDAEDGRLLEHCFYFEKDELRVMITMTVREEEAELFLPLYDEFLIQIETGV